MSKPIAILSPHPDDAVLSCWHLLSGPGEVTVINVFAGIPPPGRTGWWDSVCGATDSAKRMRDRIEEDHAALAIAGRRATNLSFLDDQYRDSQPELPRVIEELRRVLPAGAHVYAPAALGIQPDHLAARQAALSLRDYTAKLSLYADLPHASANGWPGWVTNGSPSAADVEREWAEALASIGIPPDTMCPTVHMLTRNEHASKLAALQQYPTQSEPLENYFGRSLGEPSLLGYEIEWGLPAKDG